MKEASILVAEDENIVAMDLRNRLSSLGYSVAGIAATGEEAVAKAGETFPDLILMDIRLRGDMDGVEAAAEIRSKYQLPVVYLTGQADEHTLRRAKITEPLGYLLKPFDDRELRPAIEIALHKHRVESQLRVKSMELESLLAVARILAQPIGFKEKCSLVLRELARMASADLVTMRLANGAGLDLSGSAGSLGPKAPATVSLQGSFSGEAFSSGKPALADPYPEHPKANPAIVALGVRSLVAFPLAVNQTPVGVVNVGSREPNHFSPEMVRTLSAISDGLGSI